MNLNAKLALLNQLHLKERVATQKRSPSPVSDSRPDGPQPLDAAPEGISIPGTNAAIQAHLSRLFPQALWPPVLPDSETFAAIQADAGHVDDLCSLVPCLHEKHEDAFLRLVRGLHPFWNHANGFRQAWREMARLPQIPISDSLALDTSRPWLFLDLETCGLSGSPLFLIGVLKWDGAEMVLEQYFARHYGEEEFAISSFWQDFPEEGVLITYNGKSFDWPFLEERSYANGIRPKPLKTHVDLLHVARKLFKKSLGNCKLQTLETHLCRRSRVGDIPGSLIPQAYHDYVDSGNASQMASAIHHNALDLITLAELVLFLGSEGASLENYLPLGPGTPRT